jgi:CubicO group peptidase (beta-lactamase class C family)
VTGARDLRAPVTLDNRGVVLIIQHHEGSNASLPEVDVPAPAHFIATMALVVATPALATAQTARPTDAEVARRIERYLAPLAAHELSGTLLVARGDRVMLERSYGFANHELGVPFTPTTPTNVASITKPLTIIIAFQLADAKRLALTDTVAKWLPEYVYGAQMTVAQLMNHQAGVPHRLLADDAQEEPKTATEMVLAANAMPLLFAPGSQTSYSSGGYALFAAILERAGGKSYDALLQELVARPVHATTIRHLDHRELLAGRATSVVPIGGTMINAPLRDLSFLVGGGSVYTTPRDVFAVMQGLLRGTYGANAREALVRPTGLSWNGITNGFRAFADFRAADSVSVLFFGNAHTGAIDLLRRDLPRIVAGAEVPSPVIPTVRPVALSARAQARVAGDYDTGGGAISHVTFISPSVMLFGDRALLAVNDTTFFSTADYAPVIFSGGSTTTDVIQWGAGTWGNGELGPRFTRARPATGPTR